MEQSIDPELPDFPIDRGLLFAEILLFFLPTVAISSALYYQISKELLGRDRDIGRNRGLTLAFYINTALWVIMWCIAFILKVPLQNLNHKTGLIPWLAVLG